MNFYAASLWSNVYFYYLAGVQQPAASSRAWVGQAGVWTKRFRLGRGPVSTSPAGSGNVGPGGRKDPGRAWRSRHSRHRPGLRRRDADQMITVAAVANGGKCLRRRGQRATRRQRQDGQVPTNVKRDLRSTRATSRSCEAMRQSVADGLPPRRRPQRADCRRTGTAGIQRDDQQQPVPDARLVRRLRPRSITPGRYHGVPGAVPAVATRRRASIEKLTTSPSTAESSDVAGRPPVVASGARRHRRLCQGRDAAGNAPVIRARRVLAPGVEQG